MPLDKGRAWLLASLVMAGCASKQAPTEATTQVAPPVLPEAGALPVLSATTRDLEAQRRVAEFLAMVGTVRHLAPRAPVEARLLDRAGLMNNVREHVEREVPADVVQSQGELLVALGLLPPDYDYLKGVFQLLQSQLAGFYEPHDKRMYLASDLVDRAADATLAHELVHALQDQHYDLGSRLVYRAGANDEQSAFQALVEGDATSGMMDWMLAESGRRAIDVADDLFAAEVESSMSGSAESKAVPRVLRASLVVPYVDGVVFVNQLRRRALANGGDTAGWKGVEQAWLSPPVTTEQILHLDKYDAREPAEVIPSPAAPPGDGWERAYDDVFGEEGLRVAVEEWLPRKGAMTLAEGWGGDSLALFRSPAAVAGSKATPAPSASPTTGSVKFAAAWHIRFDRDVTGKPEARARRAFQLLSKGLGLPNKGAESPSFCVQRTGVGPLAVVRSGRDLMIAAGPYRREGSRVDSDAKCPQAVRWASEALGLERPTLAR